MFSRFVKPNIFENISAGLADMFGPVQSSGDQALNDLVEEEYKSNANEESERYRNAKAGSSWLGKVISNTFDYSGKSDFDF